MPRPLKPPTKSPAKADPNPFNVPSTKKDPPFDAKSWERLLQKVRDENARRGYDPERASNDFWINTRMEIEREEVLRRQEEELFRRYELERLNRSTEAYPTMMDTCPSCTEEYKRLPWGHGWRKRKHVNGCPESSLGTS